MWNFIATAPFDRDLELAVLDWDGAHSLIFPCRRILTGWIDAMTRQRLEVSPTHWREWQPAAAEADTRAPRSDFSLSR